MYAVVEVAGRQYKVTPRDTISVPTLKEKAGTTVTFEKVLLLGDDKKVTVGTPLVAGAHVEAKVVDHAREEKVVVFKKKKRKGYRVKRGHRQAYTLVEITSIGT